MTVTLIFAGLGIAFGALSVALSVRKSCRAKAAEAAGLPESGEADQ